jgi:type II secretory pathway pseudopilin PulG
MISRRGFTLVELLALITSLAAILGATVTLMHFVLQMDTEARQRTHTVTTVGRLAEQFRHDVHQARGEPVVAADHRTAELRLPGDMLVKWRVEEANTLVRTEQVPRSADPSKASRPADREESFNLPQGTTASLESQSEGTARILTIQVDSPDKGGPRLTISALASRDHQLAVEETAAEKKP